MLSQAAHDEFWVTVYGWQLAMMLDIILNRLQSTDGTGYVCIYLGRIKISVYNTDCTINRPQFGNGMAIWPAGWLCSKYEAASVKDMHPAGGSNMISLRYLASTHGRHMLYIRYQRSIQIVHLLASPESDLITIDQLADCALIWSIGCK